MAAAVVARNLRRGMDDGLWFMICLLVTYLSFVHFQDFSSGRENQRAYRHGGFACWHHPRHQQGGSRNEDPVTDARFVADDEQAAEFLAEMIGIDPQVMGLTFALGAPDLPQQLPLGDNFSGVAGER